MTKLFLGLASLPFIASVAMAGQPVALSDTQMDKVTAGLTYATAVIPADQVLDTNFVITLGPSSLTAHVSIPQVDVIIPGTILLGGRG
jgi:hypothetical protein